MASITMKNVSVTYDRGKTKALKDLSLEVKDGEFCVFLGPSGCGKSTAMHCIAGLLHPDTGEIYINDELVTAMEKKVFVQPQQRNIAMVFQEYALYPNMTVRKNMSFALATKKVDKEEIARRVDKMAKMLSIDHLLDRKPAELSGGQRQRVALGRALVRDPNVFLLDEPLGNLDAKLREQVRYELKKIQSDLGVTTVYVTHDQTEAMTMADHIILMKDGEIVQEGTPSQLYDSPKNLFVASFLGTPLINTFSCKVSEAGEGMRLQSDEIDITLTGNDAAQLKDYAGRSVVLGIRPSDLSLANSQESSNAADSVFTGTVDSLELLGDAYLVYVRSGEKVVIFKHPDVNEPLTGTVSLKANHTKIHLFDCETEARIN